MASGRENLIREGRVSASLEDLREETERKREAFMQLLAQRYPQYADKIQGIGASPPPQAQQLEKPARSRDAHRRRTAVVNYDPHQHGNTLEYDDLGTMSDLELPSFQRGGFMRTSLPIVRSASTSLERPLGLVFLVYGDQTKKSLLPNEITTLDTVRALFVRAFPDLTLEMLESPRKKIYILDPATNIYFQLEDLAEIKDRSVLKIHETDSDEPQKVKERQEVRGRTVQMPARIQPRHGYGEVPSEFTKAQSLPPQASHTYPEMMQDQRNQWEIERRSRSRTPEPAERPRSLSAGASSRQRFSHSPDRLPTPERGPLNPIPENRQLTPGYRDQGNYYEAVGPGTHRGAYPNAIYDAPYQGYPPPSPVPPQQTYVARSTRAPPIAHPQRAVAPGPDRDVARGNNSNRHSLAFAPMSMAQGPSPDGGFQRSQSYRIPPSERDGTELLRSHSVTPADDNSRNRIEKMEQQLANLTAWVHYQKSDGSRREGVPPPRSSGSTTSDSSDTFPASSASKHKEENSPLSTIATTSTNHVVPTQGLSDIPDGYHPYSHGGSSGVSSRESTPLSAQAEVHAKIAQLKSDLHVLRRQQQLNMETMREEFMFAFNKIKKVLSAVPGAENQVNFHKRTEATSARGSYIHDRKQVNQELSDLEASVEELRTDVISRQCRVNVNDVEGMALLLSNITKSLADLKARFPEIQTQTKDVIEAEMKTAVSEEQFLKEEPGELENSLKRCKKLTGTLYTLKRLASVQDHRPPQVPNIAAGSAPVEDQKNDLLENIRALVPDHEQRVQNMEAADASRERKKKISTQQEALKFGKSLELASKNLRPPSATGGNIPESNAEDETAAKSTKKAIDCVSSSQPSQVKPAVPAKPIITSSSVPHSSMPVTVSSITTSNVASVKPSFSAALTTAKSSDKPTATVSAMTANVSDSINTTATKTAAVEPNIMRNGTMPSAHTSSGMATTVDGGTGAVTHTVKVGTESPTKNDADVNTYQVCGPVNPVFKFPVFNKDNSSATNSDKTRPTDFKEKLGNVEKSKPSSLKKDDAKPTESSLSRSEQPKKASVSFSETPTTISPTRKDSSSSPGSENRYSPEKGDLAIQKQAARNAFFSSLNTPPASPSTGSPTRNSISLDQGPVVTPGPGSGLVGKVTPGPTINLMLSGTASPKSPKSPGSFNIEVKSPPPGTEFTTSPLHSPSRGIPRLHPDNKAVSLDSSTSNMSQAEASGKQKKVPPPPPPRKGSRPMSGTSVSPVNGGPPDSSTQGAAQEPPQFVGGVLGQHRLSGGPLSSTPKPASQQKPMSRFEKDIASGIYANMNRPDLQNQKSSPQQMINEAKPSSSDSKSKESVTSTISKVDASIPPPPSVTLRALDRDERGSSSESTSSSSGTSMGSQQSVVSVVRSSSVSVKPTASSKSKPEPPRRQSSLLAKFTGSHRDSKKMNNGNAKLNGVDL